MLSTGVLNAQWRETGRGMPPGEANKRYIAFGDSFIKQAACLISAEFLGWSDPGKLQTSDACRTPFK
jgi:hypothetical protein